MGNPSSAFPEPPQWTLTPTLQGEGRSALPETDPTSSRKKNPGGTRQLGRFQQETGVCLGLQGGAGHGVIERRWRKHSRKRDQPVQRLRGDLALGHGEHVTDSKELRALAEHGRCRKERCLGASPIPFQGMKVIS